MWGGWKQTFTRTCSDIHAPCWRTSLPKARVSNKQDTSGQPKFIVSINPCYPVDMNITTWCFQISIQVLLSPLFGLWYVASMTWVETTTEIIMNTCMICIPTYITYQTYHWSFQTMSSWTFSGLPHESFSLQSQLLSSDGLFWGYLGFLGLSSRMCWWPRSMPSHPNWPWCLGDREPNSGGKKKHQIFEWFSLPGSSQWPFDNPNGGHLTPEKVT